MQSTDIPPRFNIPWAASVIAPYIRAIPETPDPEVGSASLQQGFPPANFEPIGSGGVPPFGADFNGALNQITKWLQWQAAGGSAPYNGTFQAAIAGYPVGAMVASLTTAGLLWLSIAEDNMTDPDAAGAGWVPVWTVEPVRIVTLSGAFTTTVKDRRVGLNRTVGPAVSSTTLPSTGLFAGFKVRYEDLAGNFAAFPLTVSPPAGTIAGLASFACNVNRQSVEFCYYDSNLWSVDT